MTRKYSIQSRRRRFWLAFSILLFLLASAAAWRWTPLADEIDLYKVAAWAFSIRDHPARTPIVLAAYLIGSLLVVPVTVLIAATAIAFGPTVGSAYSLAGCLLGAAVTYGLGYFLGKDLVRKMVGAKWDRLERRISLGGIIAVTTMRLLPVAPFTIVNVVSGAFRVPIRDYFVGSLLGLAPGIIVINLFEHQIEHAIRNPGLASWTMLGVAIALSIWMIVRLQRKLGREAPYTRPSHGSFKGKRFFSH